MVGGKPRAVRASGSLLVKVEAKTVSATASPTEPPIWRKKVRLLVATPSRSRGTAFCTATVKPASEGPTPRPRISIHSQSVQVSGAGRQVGHQVAAQDQRDRGADQDPLVASDPADQDARTVLPPIRPTISGQIS